MVVDFLETFVEEADAIVMTEGQAFVPIHHALMRLASKHFQA